jgi:hypothetical protein
MTSLLTLAVCTRNRPHRLQAWVDHIQHLSITSSVHILIIDQSDAPATITTDLPIRYHPTTTRGLSQARNLALQLVDTTYIAFCDDDCLPTSTWLTHTTSALHQDDPAMLFGATYPSGNPSTYRLHHAPTWAGHTTWAERSDGWCCTALCTHTDAFRSTTPVPILECFGQGNNMVIRCDIVRQLGGFHPWLGAGAWLAAGEDVDMALLVLAHHQLVVYAPQVVIYHDAWMPAPNIASLEHGYTTGMLAVHLWHAWHGSTVARAYLRWRLQQILQHTSPTKQTPAHPVPMRPVGWRRQRISALLKGLIGGLCLIIWRRYPR